MYNIRYLTIQMHLMNYSIKNPNGDFKSLQDIDVTAKKFASKTRPVSDEDLEQALEYFINLHKTREETRRRLEEEHQKKLDEIWSISANLKGIKIWFLKMIKTILQVK